MRSNWSSGQLGELCQIVNGGTPKTGIAKYWNGDHLWITPAEMGKRLSPYVGETERKLTDLGLQNSSARLLPPCSVILSSRAPIGHLVINTLPMATNQGCKGLIPKDRLDSKYLYYYLAANVELLNSLGTGATFKELSGARLREVSIRFPSLAEQRRIVGILDKAFDAIAVAKANTEKNLQNARALLAFHMESAFSGEGRPWPLEAIGNLTHLARGHNPPKSKFSRQPKKGYIRFYQIRDGKSDDHAVYVPDSPQLHKMEMDDIMMVAYRHIGRVFRGVSGAFNVALCKIRNTRKDLLHDDYLFQIIPTKYVKGELLKRSERSLIPSMSIEHLREVKIPLPPLSEQIRIVKRNEDFSAKVKYLEDTYKRKAQSLEELKESLLHEAFTGTL